MTLLDGYRVFFDKAEDPNLKASLEKDGIFYIFRSIEAWKEEKCNEDDIPVRELVIDELIKNRFIAPP